jgi:RNA 2',3'-cyclic 3'-phosphodiesterase
MTAGTRTRRLFVGVELDPAARAGCAAAADQLRRTGFAARYEEAGKLHVTLAFLGNVAASGYDAIAAALTSAAAAGCAPFVVTLDKLGAFPHERKPRVVYMGAREQGPAFRSLANSVRAAYLALGFTFKDDPVAHVTIARVKETHRPLPTLDLAPVPVGISSLTLFESLFDAEKNTSRYETAASVSLAGASPPSGD